MTLAQMFAYIENTNFYDHSCLAPMRLELIKNSGLIRNPTKAELTRWSRCMFIPFDILRNANHPWALELSLRRVGDEDTERDLRWLANKLQNYIRVNLIGEIERCLPLIVQNRLAFNDLSLNEALTEVIREGVNPTRQGVLARAQQAEEIANAERQRLAEIQAIQERVRSTEVWLQQMQARLLELNGGQVAEYIPPIAQETKMEYALLNNCIPIEFIDENGSKITRYLDRSKLARFEELFTTQLAPDSEEDACAICMTNRGDLQCGNVNGGTKCGGTMCWNCFHSHHVKNKHCAFCRKEYITLGQRNAKTEATK